MATAGLTVVGPAQQPAVAAPAAADAVAHRVEALAREYAHRSAEAAAAAAALAAGFSVLSSADESSQDAERRLARARSARRERARALYVDGAGAGGALGLLTAGSTDEALWRMSVGLQIGDRLLAADAYDERAASAQAQQTGSRSNEADAAAARLSRALGAVREQELAAQAALDRARAELATLDAQARARQAARAAAALLDQAQTDAAAARLSNAGPVGALGIPLAYEQAYRQAATTCSGMDWTLLAGVGQVESGHGRNNGPSSAGAIGPMQFMPATFAAYAVDGDGDGVTDAWSPQDAIFTAARYLCEGGAGHGAAGVHKAVFRYNHAEWYVDLVLAAQAAITARQAR
jgi:membrane-bound lytic murein transglycosylase B